MSKQYKFDYDPDDTTTKKSERELLQTSDFPDYYFKLALSTKNDPSIRIYNKKTGKLFQELGGPVEFFYGIDEISAGDANNDGHYEFTIFLTTYSNPMRNEYGQFLWDPAKKKFVYAGEITD